MPSYSGERAGSYKFFGSFSDSVRKRICSIAHAAASRTIASGSPNAFSSAGKAGSCFDALSKIPGVLLNILRGRVTAQKGAVS